MTVLSTSTSESDKSEDDELKIEQPHRTLGVVEEDPNDDNPRRRAGTPSSSEQEDEEDRYSHRSYRSNRSHHSIHSHHSNRSHRSSKSSRSHQSSH